MTTAIVIVVAVLASALAALFASADGALLALDAADVRLTAPLRALADRHGTRATAVLDDARSPADLGEDFGAGLTEREVTYLRENEWAITADDVLWRRTKCGLPMTQSQRARVAEYVGG